MCAVCDWECSFQSLRCGSGRRTQAWQGGLASGAVAGIWHCCTRMATPMHFLCVLPSSSCHTSVHGILADAAGQSLCDLSHPSSHPMRSSTAVWFFVHPLDPLMSCSVRSSSHSIQVFPTELLGVSKVVWSSVSPSNCCCRPTRPRYTPAPDVPRMPIQHLGGLLTTASPASRLCISLLGSLAPSCLAPGPSGQAECCVPLSCGHCSSGSTLQQQPQDPSLTAPVSCTCRIVKEACSSDKSFQIAVNSAFEAFLNLGARAPEYLSLFMDDRLRKGAPDPWTSVNLQCCRLLPVHQPQGAVCGFCGLPAWGLNITSEAVLG